MYNTQYRRDKVLFYLILLLGTTVLYSSNSILTDKINSNPITFYGGYETKLLIENHGTLYSFVSDNTIYSILYWLIVLYLLRPFIRSRNIKVVMLFGLLAMGIYFMFSHINKAGSPVFDIAKKEFYYGGAIIQSSNFNKSRHIQFKVIYGLQIIKGNCLESNANRGWVVLYREKEHKCYELNIVLADGRRYNLETSESYDKISDDAKILSEVLVKPIIDEIE